MGTVGTVCCSNGVKQNTVKLDDPPTLENLQPDKPSDGTATTSGDPPQEDRDSLRSESESTDDDEEIPEPLPLHQALGSRAKARTSVSAEAFGAFNPKVEFKPPRYPKNSDQRSRLRSILQQSFMFQQLEDQEFTLVLQAMKEVRLQRDDVVIQQGDDGDELFVVEGGRLNCSIKEGESSKVVKTCARGDVFGELALLYNCPRAASVVAIQPSICWSLDRQTFTHIVKDAAQRRRAQYDSFIASVSLLQELEASERHQLVDVLKPEQFFQGDYVVQQGDPGHKFYILEEGSATAEKSTPEGPQKVKDYSVGDYFGELALLRDAPRAASVKVTSERAKVLSLDREAFDALLGPLRDKMDGHANSYK